MQVLAITSEWLTELGEANSRKLRNVHNYGQAALNAAQTDKSNGLKDWNLNMHEGEYSFS